MPDTTDTRALIEIAMETVARKERKSLSEDPRCASAFIWGYYAHIESMQGNGSGEVKQAGVNVASLTEKFEALVSERDARIAELEAQLEQCKTVITEANNSLYGSHGFFLGMEGSFDKQHLSRPIEDVKQALRQKAVGVVVNDDMAKVFANKYWYNEAWKSFETLDAIKDAIAAALTSAHPVPLVSVEPFYWRDDNCKSVHVSRDGAAAQNNKTVSPLFAGFPEPAQRGEG